MRLGSIHAEKIHARTRIFKRAVVCLTNVHLGSKGVVLMLVHRRDLQLDNKGYSPREDFTTVVDGNIGGPVVCARGKV